MADTSRDSLATLQKKSLVKRTSTVKKDAVEFGERQSKQWQDSSSVTACARCQKKFSMTKRKHHCRECGNVFCSKCTAFQVVVNGALKRACASCYDKTMHRAEGEGNDKSLPVVYAGERPSDIPANTAVDLTEGKLLPKGPAGLGSASSLPAWVEAILFIRVEDDKPKIRVVHQHSQQTTALPAQLLEDIFKLALLHIPRNTRTQADEKFIFRVRDKALAGTPLRDEHGKELGTAISVATEFLNCYAHFQYLDTPSGAPEPHSSKVCQQAMVLVSRWPFPQLAFRLLEQLDEAILWQANEMKADSGSEDGDIEGSEHWKEYEQQPQQPSQSRGSMSLSPAHSNSDSSPLGPKRGSFTFNRTPSVVGQGTAGSVSVEVDEDIVSNVLIVCSAQMDLWPSASPGVLVYLHAFGDVLHHIVEADVLQSYRANMSWAPALAQLNLVSLLAPLGLLQHLWTLWELCVTGQDIVVVAPSAAQCTELVLGLASLLIPLAAAGDIRPYIHAADSDLPVLAAMAQLKHSSGGAGGAASSRSMIVGLTDPKGLALLEPFAAALFVYPTADDQGYLTDSDAAYKGLRTRNAADCLKVKNSAFSEQFAAWLERGTRKCALIVRTAPYTVCLTRLLHRVKRLLPEDRCVLGDAMLRDHLTTLTRGMFQVPHPGPIDTQVNPERERREYEIERARLQQLQAADAKGMLGLGMDDLRAWLAAVPRTLLNNVPYAIMWTSIVLGYCALYLLGVPFFFIALSAFLLKVPDTVPPALLNVLGLVLPESLLTGSQGAGGAGQTPNPNPTPSGAPLAPAAALVPRNMSGRWKRVRADNYEAFLAAQGASYVQRKLALSISMVHTITMDEALTAFRLQEKGGPIDTDNLYAIGSTVPVPTVTASTTFNDTVRWDGGNLIVRKVRTPEAVHGYELRVSRHLEGDSRMVMEARYVDSKGKEVVSDIVYELLGPSPNAPPAGCSTSEAVPSADTSSAVQHHEHQLQDLSGVWQRSKTHNFEAFIGCTGAGFMQRKLAAQMALTHTITMDKALTAFRLQEKGGPINLDNTLTVGADWVAVELSGKRFQQKCYWDPKDRNALVNQRRAEDGSYEMLMTRALAEESDGQQIVLRSLFRDLPIGSGREVEATSWFTRTGPSPNPLPVPDLSLLKAAAAGTTQEVPASTPEEVAEDNEEDDDEVAVSKMRSKSVAARRAKGLGAGAGTTGITAEDMSGDWEQQTSTSAKGRGGYMNWMQHRARIRYTITMTPASLRIVEVDHKTLVEDCTLVLGHDEMVTVVNKKRKGVRARAYWEGGVLVVHKVIPKSKCEVFVRRELAAAAGAEGEQVMRQVTIRRDTATGSEAEFIAVFRKVPSK